MPAMTTNHSYTKVPHASRYNKQADDAELNHSFPRYDTTYTLAMHPYAHGT